MGLTQSFATPSHSEPTSGSLIVSIRVECEACGKVLNAKDDAAGKKAKCPDCGNVLQIPAQEVVDAETADQDGFGSANNDEEDSGSDDRRPCPACGEDIKKNAAKCRFCGEIFDKALKNKAKREAGGDDADLTTGDWIVGVLCSGIGCIVGIVWMIQGKPKGIKMIGLSLLVQAVLGVVRVAVEMANQGR